MKRVISLCLVLMLAVCVLIGLPMQAEAADTGVQDGLEIAVLTNQTAYSADEDIQVTITVRNTNDYPVEGISVQALLPHGLELKGGALTQADITLSAGQTHTLTLTAKQGTGEWSPETGEFGGMFLLVVLAAAVIGLAVMVKKGQKMRVLSLLLCAAMLLSMTPMAAFATENETGSIRVDKTVTVDGQEYTIQVDVTYQISAQAQNRVAPEIAALYGVDPDEIDSDEDGLSNYAEIYLTGTHPAMVDTDKNGTSDADEDADADGISNIEEIQLGTDPAKADTDNDGITDPAEISLGTDPSRYDTDGDTLSDNDEQLLGLNPLAQYTDGKMLDAARVFTQKLDSKNFEEQLTASENVAVPSLTLTTTGNINRRVSVTEAASQLFSDSRAVVGKPVNVTGKKIGQGTITFTLNTAAATVNTKTICRYNEDGTTEYLTTDYDADANTLSAQINGEGTYYVVDVKTMFDEMGLAMPANTVKRQARSVSTFAAGAQTASTDAMAQADIVFLIDSTGSMEDIINCVKNNAEAFVDALKQKGVSAALALIDYQDLTADGYDTTTVHQTGGSNWFYDLNAFKAALSGLELGHGGDAPRVCRGCAGNR